MDMKVEVVRGWDGVWVTVGNWVVGKLDFRLGGRGSEMVVVVRSYRLKFFFV